ncbi:hypothetical protein E2C01_091706 [Portunus trituberculatus]|uniref:Uncharacterized protein n=1 Tax=Portunus trituberculatus TaxID=210409 RepID=A0A5B7JTK0_PORTR|nr:hypothetical protein [Portunus trituberculatus]
MEEEEEEEEEDEEGEKEEEEALGFSSALSSKAPSLPAHQGMKIALAKTVEDSRATSPSPLEDQTEGGGEETA